MGRLSRRLRDLGLSSFEAYYRLVTREDEREKVRLVEALCTHETRFFREATQLELFKETIFPEWEAQAEAEQRPRHIRVWSAACSSGEEAYTLAMLLLRSFPASSGWTVEILATDISNRVLQQARRAVWPIQRADEIPKSYRKCYMLRGTRSHADEMTAGPELRSVVRFTQLNLNDASYPVGRPFDAIFCRNVLIYFSPESRVAVIQRLVDHLVPGACLFLGHAETLVERLDGLKSLDHMTYRWSGPGRHPWTGSARRNSPS